uniref:DUF3431 domain-containing protein n=1 Tax=viral metagenome TaxID=1070528 RepID=A0A6C0DUT1_9ZZZZ
MIIVVARYNEDVTWTKQFPNVVIYNKGDKLEDTSYRQFFLNNVGREGHTYFKYICDNYDNLEDYTIFLQGKPFDHSPNVIYNVTKYVNNADLNIDFEYLSEDIWTTTFDREATRFWQNKGINHTYSRVFGIKPVNNECIFGCGAQFIVSKERILQRPRAFYENIVKILDYTINPTEGYDIERFHKYIFS